ncbi:MAG: hypothetical protein QOH58_3102 [Thermoleophilaceae bacterium]|jgi:glyoxylase-like metal-dependent hydrolase (beta-lactamase superfamily II)|nr:hypothetical protein [Thermoleophilaceae bacterium]
MQELTREISHWTAVHPNLGTEVSSYWLPSLGVLLDPIAVPGEVEGVEEILLSNRHHLRDALAARERFGATLRAPRVGMHEFDDDAPIEPYEFGEPLAGGAITAHQVTELWPDDSVLHIPSLGALAVADGVIHYGGELQFVPEQYMDDPEAEKQSIREGLARLTDELAFEHVLLAHGTPIVGDGRERLRAFARG